MARARKASRPANAEDGTAAEPAHERAPVTPRKHPWLLAISIVLLLAWLVFLVAMAMR